MKGVVLNSNALMTSKPSRLEVCDTAESEPDWPRSALHDAKLHIGKTITLELGSR